MSQINLTIKKTLLLVIALWAFGAASFVYGSGSATELPVLFDAKRLSSDHFEVIFSPELETVAREAARIAERAHQFWTELLQFKFSEPIFIVLTDRRDEASASISVLPQLVIYLDHPFGDAFLLEQKQSYSTLEYLVFREVGNLLDAARAEGFPRELRVLFGNIVLPRSFSPAFYHVGLSVSETDDTSYSAMIMAALAASNSMPSLAELATSAERMTSDVRNLQALSKEFLNYLRATLGDETFRKLFEFSAAYPLPSLASGAFQAVTGRPAGEVFEQFQNELARELASHRAQSEDPDELQISPGGMDVGDASWSPDGSSIIYEAGGRDRASGLHLGRLETGENRALLACQCRSPGWLDASTLIYAKAVEQTGGETYYDLFVLDLASLAERRLTTGERVWSVLPLRNSASQVLMLRNGLAGESDLVLFDLVTRSRRIIQEFAADTAPLGLAIAPNGQSVALALRNNITGYEIRLLDLSGVIDSKISIGGRKIFDPEFTPDGQYLIFISDFEGRFQPYALQLQSGSVFRVQTSASGERAVRLSPSGVETIVAQYTASGFTLMRRPFEPSRFESVGLLKDLSGAGPISLQSEERPAVGDLAGEPARDYEVDAAIIPTFWVPVVGTWHVGEFTKNQEPSGRIDYQISLGTNFAPLELFYDFAYNHKTPLPWVRVRLQGTGNYQRQTALLEFPLDQQPASSASWQIGVYRSPDETEIFSQIFLPVSHALDLTARESSIAVRGGWSTTIAGLARRVTADWSEKWRLSVAGAEEPHWISMNLGAAWSDLSDYRLGGPDSDRPLRGFAQPLRGSQRISLNLSYEFPLARLNWGCCALHPFPLFIREVRGTIFSDMGTIGRSIKPEELRASLGLELQLQVALGYGLINGWLRAGVAYGLGAGQPQLYFQIVPGF